MTNQPNQSSTSEPADLPAITLPPVPPEHVAVIAAAVACVLGQGARVRSIVPSDDSPNIRPAWTREEVPVLKHQQRPEPRKPSWGRASGG